MKYLLILLTLLSSTIYAVELDFLGNPIEVKQEPKTVFEGVWRPTRIFDKETPFVIGKNGNKYQLKIGDQKSKAYKMIDNDLRFWLDEKMYVFTPYKKIGLICNVYVANKGSKVRMSDSLDSLRHKTSNVLFMKTKE